MVQRGFGTTQVSTQVTTPTTTQVTTQTAAQPAIQRATGSRTTSAPTLSARTFELTTPLGANVLLFHHMTVTEELGRLADYQLDALSESGDINPDDILGKSVTIKMELPDGGDRYFSAYVTRFGLVGMEGRYHKYHAILKPWLWFLTRTQDCRIYQNKTAPEIIKEVFEEHEVAKYKLELTESYRTRDYCVQYRESDFDFISRLMEEEGIYYYFDPSDNRDMLVLTDSYAAHSSFPHYEEIAFLPKGQSTRPEREYIGNWACEREIRPGKYVLHDFDFEKPSVNLAALTSLQRSHGLADYEIFDYPGSYTNREDGEKYARIRMEELQARHELVNADSNARGVAVGRLFKLTGHPRSDQNREYLVVKASFELHGQNYETGASDGASFSAHLTGLHSQQPFRTKQTTTRPAVQGPQTAIVVGPAGEEIYTDDHGRVKVQFHWDRYGQSNENSSCWMRVSQPWAGKGWGAVSTPRIGQEVIVDFLEGDPDRPIITGRVFNADQKVPHGGVISGLKSQTHKGQGSNEMTMDDTAGAEKLNLLGQHDMQMRAGNDQSNWVGNNQSDFVQGQRSSVIATGDDSTTVTTGMSVLTANKDIVHTSLAGNYQLNVPVGAHAVMVKNDSTRTVETGNDILKVLAGMQDETIQLGASLTVKSGPRSVKATGGDYTAESTDGNASITAAKTAKLVGKGELGALVDGKPHAELHGEPTATVSSTDTTEIKGNNKVNIGPKEVFIDGSTKVVVASGQSCSVTVEPSKVSLQSSGGSIVLDSSGIHLTGMIHHN
ncbi:MAG: type VI secretion system tip protein VgrG [Gammaproteobacteria bacterium]|nr:type VI secretion system tip protein VgrG [Gammaproteobacteria bacterium]